MTTAIDMLGQFDGKDVMGAGAKLAGTNRSLSSALKMDPTLLHSGDKVVILIEAVVGGITHEPLDESDGFIRIHNLNAGLGMLVDESLVNDVLNEQRKRIDEAKGITGLPFADGDDWETDETGSPDESDNAGDTEADPDGKVTPIGRGKATK